MGMDTEALTSGAHSVAIEGVEQRYHVAGQRPLASFIRVVQASAGSIYACRSSSGS